MLASNILSYSDFLKDTPEPMQIGLAIVKRYKEISNITQVAKEFHTTRLTVRKWVKRFFPRSHPSSVVTHKRT